MDDYFEELENSFTIENNFDKPETVNKKIEESER